MPQLSNMPPGQLGSTRKRLGLIDLPRLQFELLVSLASAFDSGSIVFRPTHQRLTNCPRNRRGEIRRNQFAQYVLLPGWMQMSFALRWIHPCVFWGYCRLPVLALVTSLLCQDSGLLEELPMSSSVSIDIQHCQMTIGNVFPLLRWGFDIGSVTNYVRPPRPPALLPCRSGVGELPCTEYRVQRTVREWS